VPAAAGRAGAAPASPRTAEVQPGEHQGRTFGGRGAVHDEPGEQQREQGEGHRAEHDAFRAGWDSATERGGDAGQYGKDEKRAYVKPGAPAENHAEAGTGEVSAPEFCGGEQESRTGRAGQHAAKPVDEQPNTNRDKPPYALVAGDQPAQFETDEDVAQRLDRKRSSQPGQTRREEDVVGFLDAVEESVEQPPQHRQECGEGNQPYEHDERPAPPPAPCRHASCRPGVEQHSGVARPGAIFMISSG
jgi:hypothetical protein